MAYVAVIILGSIALCFYIFACLQLAQMGFLLNNAYLYASRQEREAMDKKPYYRQSGVVFLLLGTVFALHAVEAVLQTDWLSLCAVGIVAIAIVYAIVSTVRIEKRKKND